LILPFPAAGKKRQLARYAADKRQQGAAPQSGSAPIATPASQDGNNSAENRDP
jgi:hypothetical protein